MRKISFEVSNRLAAKICTFHPHSKVIADKQIARFVGIFLGRAIRVDEFWESSTCSGKASQPNCVAGEALMFHFSYFTTVKQMLELGFLKEFENIVLMELFGTLPRTLWNATDFFRPLCLDIIIERTCL